jgi:FkbM family methyltransferase
MNNISETYYNINFSNGCFKFFVFDNCFISQTIRNNKIWEPHMHDIFDKFIKKDSIVIECGCHIGSHTIKMASLCEKIYGFEPMPATYNVLKKNIELNSITNAIIYEKGVSDNKGTTTFHWIGDGDTGQCGLDNNPMGKPSWIKSTDETINVELITIDSLNLDKLDFMKIDVEGYEPLVIKGGFNTIKKCKPVIIMEVWKNHFGEVDINYTKELFKELLDIGYEVELVFGSDFLFTPK